MTTVLITGVVGSAAFSSGRVRYGELSVLGQRLRLWNWQERRPW
jgi:hypothetical protein